MTTLVDTSVWRHYLNGTLTPSDKARMDGLLDQDDGLVCYPAVLGELLLGGLSPSAEALIRRLPTLGEISGAQTLAFIQLHGLAPKGVGWVDCQLLACARNAGARLWTLDKNLADAALASSSE
jgi:predicted nucleic acid-binding protein